MEYAPDPFFARCRHCGQLQRAVGDPGRGPSAACMLCGAAAALELVQLHESDDLFAELRDCIDKLEEFVRDYDDQKDVADAARAKVATLTRSTRRHALLSATWCAATLIVFLVFLLILRRPGP